MLNNNHPSLGKILNYMSIMKIRTLKLKLDSLIHWI